MADLSTNLPAAAIQHSTVNLTAIEAWKTRVATSFNNHTPAFAGPINFAAAATRLGGALAGANAYNPARLANVWKYLAVTFANDGTSIKTVYRDVDITLPTIGTTTGEHVSLSQLIEDMKAQGITTRMFGRHLAQEVFQYGHDNNIEWRVGRKAGVDSKFGYAAFDFAIYVNGMNSHERAAADATSQIALARSAGGATRVNNAIELTRGNIPAANRSITF